MKQSFLKFAGKKLITSALLSSALLFATFNSNAATSSNNIEIVSGNASSIEYTGSTEDALMLKLHVNNENANNFTVTVKDEQGNVLFSKSFSDVNFDKQFKVLKTDSDSDKYYFSVRSSNKNLDQTFVVSSTTKTVNDVVVNKL